jgi:hypothetical protein
MWTPRYDAADGGAAIHDAFRLIAKKTPFRADDDAWTAHGVPMQAELD